MEATIQEARSEGKNRFVCRDRQTPIFISGGSVKCGRENDHCWLKAAYGECLYRREEKKLEGGCVFLSFHREN